MVREDYFKSAHALTEGMRNLYGVRVGRETFCQRLPCLQDPEEAPVDCQSSPAPPRLVMEEAELSNFTGINIINALAKLYDI